jgi:hypothetical protein
MIEKMTVIMKILKELFLTPYIYIGVIVFLFIFYFGNQHYNKEKRLLKNNYKTTEATITKYGIIGRSIVKHVIYTFYVDNKKYDGSISNINYEYFETLCFNQGYFEVVGAKFEVEYYPKNPFINRVLIGDSVYQSSSKIW